MESWRKELQVLLVEDDEMVRESLAGHLRRNGLAVETATHGEEGIARAASQRFDVILLDVMLPDLDGRKVCRRMRQMGIQTPVILLTAMTGDEDVIEGLDSGANDYVVKPLRPKVLLARIRAHLRQHDRTDDAEFDLGTLRFRPGAKELVAPDGERTRLTEKETELLKCLLRAESRPVPRNELLDEVWGYSPLVATHTLETHVYRLRRKLDPKGSGERLLATEAGGYRLLRPAVKIAPGNGQNPGTSKK